MKIRNNMNPLERYIDKYYMASRSTMQNSRLWKRRRKESIKSGFVGKDIIW